MVRAMAMDSTELAGRLAVLAATIRSLERQMQELQDEVISVDVIREWHGGNVYYSGQVHYRGDPVALHDLVGGGPVKLEWAPTAVCPYRWEFEGLGIQWHGHCDGDD